MSDSGKTEKLSEKKNKQKEKKNKYVNWWLFRNKGTVAEPWSTAEELWDNPKVQEAIKNHNNLVKNRNGS